MYYGWYCSVKITDSEQYVLARSGTTSQTFLIEAKEITVFEHQLTKWSCLKVKPRKLNDHSFGKLWKKTNMKQFKEILHLYNSVVVY